MEITRLSEPVPISNGVPLSRRSIDLSGVLLLPRVSGQRLPSIDEVLEGRRSRREFGLLSIASLSDLLWLTLRSIEAPNDICAREHRPLPSFGGLHVIHCLFINVPGMDGQAGVYEPRRHALGILTATGETVKAVVDSFSTVLPIGNGVLVVFAADVERARSSYQNVESLIWRDAGVLIGGLALVAEAMGLSFCALGRIGQTEVDQLLPGQKWMAAGAALLGARTH
jgi:SagB-type dehydrogenase family enzyme